MMNEFEYYTYEVNRETGVANVYGWDHYAGSPRKNFITSYRDVKDARSDYPGIYDTHPANDCFPD
jgi:hypothetical protein